MFQRSRHCGAAVVLGLLVCVQAADGREPRVQQKPAVYRIISGRVIDSRGGPPPSGLELTVGTEQEDSSFSSARIAMAADGSFTTAPLAPATYVLQLSHPGRLTPGEPDLEGELRTVRITTADVSGVVLRTRPPYALTGRFRMESDNPAAAWPPVIVVTAFVAADGTGFLGASTAEGASGGRFILRDVYGPRVLRCGYRQDGRSRWWPGHVLLDGVDITDVPTDFSAAQGRRLEIVFTQHPPRVAGTVTDSHGHPVSQAWVVSVPADPAVRQRWSARVNAVQADVKGVFDFASLPGRYLVTAVRPRMWLSRDDLLKDLERVARGAAPVELKDRQRASVAIRVKD